MDADLELPPSGFVVSGPNGHGKTSLIEALMYAEVFRSFRGSRDADLVRFGEAGFHVGADRVAAGYDVRTGAKRVTVDGTVPDRLTEAIGLVRGVVLSPSDVELVAAGPKLRRQLLDVLLSLTVRGYVEALGKYRRALRHRVHATPDDMPVWERALAEHGGRIVKARAAWVREKSGRYSELCGAVGEVGDVGLAYHHSAPSDGLEAALLRTRERDVARGRTSVGPHRDDLRLTLDGRDLRTYGSAGQQRTAAIALRILEAETLGAGTLFLDDAFAELDAERGRRLGALVEGMAERGTQVIAAVPKDADVPKAVGSLPRWRIGNGAIRR